MEYLVKFVGAIILVAVLALVFAMLMAWPTQWLWNNTLPELFKLPNITFWQALRLAFLCGILFKGSSSSSSSKS